MARGTLAVLAGAALLAAMTIVARPERVRAAAAFETKTVSFAISFNGETSAYGEMSAFVTPAEALTIAAVGGPPGDYELDADPPPVRHGPRTWSWRAPKVPGIYSVRVHGPAKRESILLHVFVMVPATEVRDGMLNGYRIGTYPKPLNGNPIYRPPPGFVEVTKANEDVRVTPHFRLRQFVCKESPPEAYPKYVFIRERLLLKLEAVLEEVNALGFDADTLHVMSAYRTPYYNHAIGDVPYSMHQFGSAADIFVDSDNRGRMDDLTHDGRVDTADSKFLYDEIELMLGRGPYRRFEGGMGFYPATSAHPPFVHVDVRGTHARWKG